jgi:predicted  nucleic acid-binding Zn-ribbon protein
MTPELLVTDLKVDVGVLKTQVLTLSSLCNKMDTIIEKLVQQHERHIEKVYVDMNTRKVETEADIKELHLRIDTVLDKLQDSERRITAELKSLREEMTVHNKQERDTLNKILQWKWMVAGGVIAISWLLSRTNLDTLGTIIK